MHQTFTLEALQVTVVPKRLLITSVLCFLLPQ
jgi:hypothetical protein